MSVFPRGLASRSLQAKKPYFALSAAFTCYHLLLYSAWTIKAWRSYFIINQPFYQLKPLRAWREAPDLHRLDLHRRHIYHTSHEYYPHDIDYSIHFLHTFILELESRNTMLQHCKSIHHIYFWNRFSSTNHTMYWFLPLRFINMFRLV